jgi:RimJ/RimL family protein N-acetyltransferase
MNKIVQGNNLFIRKLEYSDLDRTWEWLHRPDIYSKIGVQVPFTKSDQEKWFAKLQNDKAKIVFAVCQNIDNKHIGNMSLDMIDRRHQNARLSIFIADKAARSRGCGSEALGLLEQYAFSIIGLHKIWCKTDAGYPEILAFYKKSGFREEGTLREHEFKDGQFIDKIMLAKIAS